MEFDENIRLQDQSVALIGRAGSGKSTNFRHVVSYLALAGGESSILSLDKYDFFFIIRYLLWY